MDQIASDLKALLENTHVKDLLSKRDKPLVSLAHTVDVGTVLDLLSKQGILSAPVFVSDENGKTQPSISTLIGFVDVWTVLSAFLQSLPAAGGTPSPGLSAEQLESLGAALCARPVLSLFEGSAAVQAAIESGDVQGACADWEVHDDPNSSVLQVIRSCFLPRVSNTSSLTSWASGQGFAPSSSPRVTASPITNAVNSNNSSSLNSGCSGPSRHPAASHRIVVVNPEGAKPHLAVLSQSDVLRFLAAHHESLRPLGKASLAELGLATGSLYLAAGPTGAASAAARPPPLSAAVMNTTAAHSHSGPHIPSSPKPPLAAVGAYASGGLLGSLSGIPASPLSEGHFPAASLLQRAGSGPTAMQMSPPASPRVSSGQHHHLLSMPSAGHRPAARRQLVAVHDSVTALEAFCVLLQQRVSAVAVLAGTGSSVNMRLVGNLSASDLRHLKRGGFGRLALSVKQFLASKPLAPDQAIPLAAPKPAPAAAAGSPLPPKAQVLMAHAPGVYTCQATASLEELVRMLGTPQHAIHRVYVVDPDQRPAGVVTGTDVLQLLSTACA